MSCRPYQTHSTVSMFCSKAVRSGGDRPLCAEAPRDNRDSIYAAASVSTPPRREVGQAGRKKARRLNGHRPARDARGQCQPFVFGQRSAVRFSSARSVWAKRFLSPTRLDGAARI